MRLQEFFEKHINLFKNKGDGSQLYAKDIPTDVILELQNEVEELAEAKIKILHQPNDGDKSAQTMKLSNAHRFTGQLKLLSLSLTPIVSEPKDFFKKRASITPTFYDANDFTPHKYLIIPYYPELADDVFVALADKNLAKNEVRAMIHQTLDDMLDNPDKYISGKRNILIRGIFKSNEDPTQQAESITIEI